VSGWPQVTIPREDKRVRYIEPWDVFPQSLKVDVDDYLKILSGEKLFDSDDTPKRPLRPTSLAERAYQFRGAASALVAMGVPPARICSINDLARLEPMRLILTHFRDRGQGKHDMGARNVAKTLRAAAKHRVKVDDAELLLIDKLLDRLPRQRPGLTSKNRERLRPFKDPAFLADYLALPYRLAAELKRKKQEKKTVVDAVMAQVLVAIAILQVIPLRMRNLVNLDLRRHLIAHGNHVYIEIPSEEVKNARSLELQLPDEVVDLISWYCVQYRDLLVETPSNALFPNRHGNAKDRATLGMQITRLIRRHLGAEINPHLFRHIAAKLYLKAHPGEFATVSLLLGHHSVATTMNAYTGTEDEDASRIYQNLVQSLREDTAKMTGKRRKK